MAKVSSLFTEFFSNSVSAALVGTVRESSDGISSAAQKIIPLEEVSWHDHDKDCWVIIYDRVYDITDFLDEHPGGSELLLEYAGREATGAFRGFGHSSIAMRMLKKFLIGKLPPNERIFRKPGGIKFSDMPE